MKGYIAGVFIITLIATAIVGVLIHADFLQETKDTVYNAVRLYFAPLNTWWFWMVMIAVSIYFAL